MNQDIYGFIEEELHRAVEAIRYGEEWIPPAEMDDLDDHDLGGALTYLSMMAQAVKNLSDHVRKVHGGRIGDGKAQRLGDHLYRVKAKTKPVVLLEGDQLYSLLGEDLPKVFRMSGYEVRKGALKAVAEKRGQKGLFDTIFDEQFTGDYTFEVVEITFAPKKFHDMKDGEIR